MADINHSYAHEAHEANIPVQPDGVSFRGVFWSVAIMFATTVFSQLFVIGAFKWLDHQVKQADTPRAPLAAPQGQLPPAPNLLYEYTGTAEQNEPGYLAQYREREQTKLHGYSLDTSGTAHISIDRAKELILERGVLNAAAPAAATPATPAKGAPEKAH